MNVPKHIGIAGNIGVGKTVLTEKLAKHFKWAAEFESVDNNPYLADFYEDMHRWAFHLQIYFLNSRIKQIKRIQDSDRTIIQDRTIYEDANIFAKNLFESGFISKRDFENYKSIYDSLIDLIRPPDLLIYLKADIPKLIDHIEKRGRDYETSMRIDYLKNLNQHYDEWIRTYNLGKVLQIDVNQMDFVQNEEDFSEIVNRIDAELFGLFSTQNN